jgi:hypothetical protein
VFRVSAGLGKIGIRGLQQWVLITMSKLTLHGGVASRLLGPILLYGAFTAVLVIGESRVQIVSAVSHGVSSFRAGETRQPSTIAYRKTFTSGKG